MFSALCPDRLMHFTFHAYVPAVRSKKLNVLDWLANIVVSTPHVFKVPVKLT